jgi:hypothetical protein
MFKSTDPTKYNIELELDNQKTQKKRWGFTQFSEKLNGRIAMFGFILFYFIELITKKNLVEFFLY